MSLSATSARCPSAIVVGVDKRHTGETGQDQVTYRMRRHRIRWQKRSIERSSRLQMIRPASSCIEMMRLLHGWALTGQMTGASPYFKTTEGTETS